MKTEFKYIEIENTKNNFHTHAGIHAQLDVHFPCRLIFVIEWGLHKTPHQREILSSKVLTPTGDIFKELHNKFNVGDGVQSKTKNERRQIMWCFVKYITAVNKRKHG